MSVQSIDKLIRMANQIAAEFHNQHPDFAVDATWDHLWHFWDPRMKQQIVAHRDDAGLSDIARAAVARLAGNAEPEPQTQATEFGADREGNFQADAG